MVKFQHESGQTLNNFDDVVWKIVKKSQKFVTKICWNIEVWAVQKHVNLADLVKSFPTNIYLQKSASIQPRTSHLMFIILAASRDLIFTERSSPIDSACSPRACSPARPPVLAACWHRLANSANLPNFRGLVLGCIEADVCKTTFVLQESLQDLRTFAPLPIQIVAKLRRKK